MTTAIDVLQALGSFVVGLAARMGLFLAAGVALALPALAIAFAWRAVQRRREREAGLPAGARLAPNHTWLAPRANGTLAVGLDEVAQRILPSSTGIELPSPGMSVHRGDPIVVIRAGKRIVRVTAPVDGIVRRVNSRVRRAPGLVKQEPYSRGWLFAVEPSSDEWKKLPADTWADAWLHSEKRRLVRFVEDELGMAAADGGDLVAPGPALLGDEGWEKVVQAFMRAA